jgi:tetratricopeptide (TPR) repeat protein
LWAESYDRDLKDISYLQGELAQTIAKQVGLSASPGPTREKSINPAAHEAYLLGRYYWFGGPLEKSRQFFQEAIDVQPDYAEAWSGLAHYYGAIGATGTGPASSVIAQVEAAARKSVELDDSLPEGHSAMAGLYYFYKWDWERAERESARAIELNPSYAEGHHLRGYILQTLNRTDEALQEQKKSKELDPFARPWVMVNALIDARQFDAALKDARIRSEHQPDSAGVHEILSNAYWMKGMEQEASTELELSLILGGEKDAAAKVHNAFQRGGFRAVLELRLDELKQRAKRGYVSPMSFAELYGALRRKEETLRFLEASYEEHSPQLVHIQSNAVFDFLHSEPRYQTIVKNMGLTPAY